MRKLLLASLMTISTLVSANNSGANFFYYGDLPDDKQVSNKVTIFGVRPVFYNTNDQIRNRLPNYLKPMNNKIIVTSSSKNLDEDQYVLSLIKYHYVKSEVHYTNKFHMEDNGVVIINKN